MATELQDDDSWHDVNLSLNWAVMVRGMRKYFPSCTVSQVIAKLPPHLQALLQAEQEKDENRALSLTTDRFVPLGWYIQIEFAVVTVLGHPSHLRTLGQAAVEVAHGSTDFGEWMLKLGLKYITDPRLGARSIPRGTRLWNDSKRWTQSSVPGLITLVGHYVEDARTGIRRSPQDDALSLMYFIPGVTSTFPAHWEFQDPVSDVTLKAVPVNLEAFLKKWLGNDQSIRWLRGAEASKDDQWVVNPQAGDRLFVNGELCGTVIRYKPNGHTVNAIRLDKTISSVCTRTSELLPLVHAGTVFQLDDANELGTVIMEVVYNHVSKTILQFVHALILAATTFFVTLAQTAWDRLTRRVEGQVALSATVAVSKAETQRERYMALRFRELLGHGFRDEGWLRGMLRSADGTGKPFERRFQFAAVVFLDIMAFTKIELKRQKEVRGENPALSPFEVEKSAAMEVATLVGKFHEFADQTFCLKFRGLTPKSMGDGGLYFFTTLEEQDDPSVPDVQVHLVDTAISAALEFQKCVNDAVDPDGKYGIQVRIGIHCGNVVIQTTGGRLDVLNCNVNYAQRHEQKAEPGSVLISWAAAQVLQGQPFEILFGHVIEGKAIPGVDRFDILKKLLPVGTTLTTARRPRLLVYKGEQAAKADELLHGFRVVR